jgi:hypothetical protein
MARNVVPFPGAPVRTGRIPAISAMVGILNSAEKDGEPPGADALEGMALDALRQATVALEAGQSERFRARLVMAELHIAMLADALRRATGEQPAK